MSRPFLELCRLFVSELGVAGGNGPPATTGQTGELRNIVNWVADADLYVQNLWTDWGFLWAFEEGSYLPAGTNTINSVTRFGHPIEEGLVLFSNTTTPHKPLYLDWREFRGRYGQRPVNSQRAASAWTVRPDGCVVLSHNTTATETHWLLEYQRAALRMSDNADTSPIPDHFDRIIIARAAITYGIREDAPEIVSGYAAEYADTLEKMEAHFLPGQRSHRRGQGVSAAPDFLGGS